MAFIRSNWFLGIIILLAVGAIVGVIYGVTTHTEPGLMAETPGFTSSDLPIPVCPSGYVPDVEGTQHAIDATTNAVNAMNERLGFQALEVNVLVGAGCSTHGITVIVGTPTEHAAQRDPGGDAVFHAGDRECAVTTSNTGTDALLDLVLQHELGHCLGLDHDCYAGSIMCGGSCCTLAPTPAGSYPPRIDDSDRALLQHILHPQ